MSMIVNTEESITSITITLFLVVSSFFCKFAQVRF